MGLFLLILACIGCFVFVFLFLVPFVVLYIRIMLRRWKVKRQAGE